MDLNQDGDCAKPGEAKERCDDAVDNDCDFRVDLADVQADSEGLHAQSCAHALDQDGDSFCPAGRDRNGDGDRLDATEVTAALDTATSPTHATAIEERARAIRRRACKRCVDQGRCYLARAACC